MHCYYHPGTEAVALCKNCHRGLCTSCSVEVSNGIACRNRCEVEVQALDRMIQRGKTAYSTTGRLHSRSAVVLALMGGIMLLWGLASASAGGGWFLGSMGAVILLGAGLQYFNGRRFARQDHA